MYLTCLHILATMATESAQLLKKTKKHLVYIKSDMTFKFLGGKMLTYINFQ